MKTIKDKVFGTLHFNGYLWQKEEEVLFAGKRCEVTFWVSGEEDGVFSEDMYEAYKMLQAKWEDIQQPVLEAILKYYQELRYDRGYAEEFDESYPEIDSIDQLMDHITFTDIVVQYEDLYDGRSIGLGFDCTWDSDDVGVELCDETVRDVVYFEELF